MHIHIKVTLVTKVAIPMRRRKNLANVNLSALLSDLKTAKADILNNTKSSEEVQQY